MYVYLPDPPAGLVVLNHREGGLLKGVQTFPNGLLIVVHPPTGATSFQQSPHHHVLTALKHQHQCTVVHLGEQQYHILVFW